MSYQQILSRSTSCSFDELSDEFLLHALANGGAWAIEPLYQRYHRLLYAVAYHLVADQHAAENLLQEVFFTIWRTAGSYSCQSGSPKGWLLTLMRHRTIDYLRRRTRLSALKEITWERLDEDEYPVCGDVWEEVWHLEQRTQVRSALLHLPTEQQLVIALAYFQGWTHREIAQQYHLPLGTVKGRIRLGLGHLKRLLEQREGP